MRIGLVGPSYQMQSLPFDAQRTINLFPISDEMGKEVASLQGTPGLSLFATCSQGNGRKCFASAQGRDFAVSGSKLYEINSNGTTNERGTIDTSSGNVSIAENSTQLALCDGVNIYIFTYATNAFVKVTSGLPTTCGVVTSIDGYFVTNEVGTGRFYISNLSDGLTWDALDFATAESSPDNLISLRNINGQLFLIGSKTFEIWANVGASAFPFQRVSGAVGDVGIMAAHTLVDLDNSLIWVGQDKNGNSIVYKTNGFRPQRISTEPIENMIRTSTDQSNMLAFSYQLDGHLFYVITGSGMATSLCYDITTGLWHERAYLGESGNFEPHLAAGCMLSSSGVHLVCDRSSGNIYQLSQSVYSDNGLPLARERIFTHLSDENKNLRYNRLEIGFETGVGLQSGQGSSPTVSLQLSKDGARTWSDWHNASLGAVGKYQTKVAFRRLGVAGQMTFKIRISDPVKVSITGAYLT